MPMSKEQREETSRRMRQYWATRRANHVEHDDVVGQALQHLKARRELLDAVISAVERLAA